jgi:hypothetical protein
MLNANRMQTGGTAADRGLENVPNSKADLTDKVIGKTEKVSMLAGLVCCLGD